MSARAAGLRRELGPFSATMFTAGMMVGMGIFATPGAATAAAGRGILVAMLIGGSVAFAIGMSAAQLGVNNPTEGGAFTWARDFDLPTLGFSAGCGYLGKNLVMRTAIVASEVKQPRRTIPIAVVGGVAITAVMFVGVGAITLGVLAPPRSRGRTRHCSPRRRRRSVSAVPG